MKKILLVLLSICTLTACTACVVDLGGENSRSEAESTNKENLWSDENVDENGWV